MMLGMSVMHAVETVELEPRGGTVTTEAAFCWPRAMEFLFFTQVRSFVSSQIQKLALAGLELTFMSLMNGGHDEVVLHELK